MNGPGDSETPDIPQLLRALRDEPLPEEPFRSSLHRKLVAAGPPEPSGVAARLRPLLPWLWPLSGALAGVLAFLVSARVAAPVQQASTPALPVVATVAPPRPAPALPGTEVPASKVAILKRDFTVDVAVEEAEFQVSLPEGLAFWVGGEALAERSFSWVQPLKEGSNVVPVAVRGREPGRYTVSARARVDGRDIVHDVVLEVTAG
jgi:hypothetical protein